MIFNPTDSEWSVMTAKEKEWYFKAVATGDVDELKKMRMVVKNRMKGRKHE